VSSFAEAELYFELDDYHAKADDSVYYNYGGIGLNVEHIGCGNVSDFAIGAHYNIGYMIDETYFIGLQSPSVTMEDLFSTTSDYLVNNSHNFQLGVINPDEYFDPFAIAEIELNRFNQTSNELKWVDLNAI